MPNYGKQPALSELTEQRWSFSALADAIDVSRSHLYNACHGFTNPSDDLRQRLPQILGVKLEDLFTPEALAGKYTGNKRVRNRRHNKPLPSVDRIEEAIRYLIETAPPLTEDQKAKLAAIFSEVA